MPMLKSSVRVNHSVNIKDIKQDDGGAMGVKAVFATTGVVDKHGDVIEAGAIGEQDVIMSAYGHNSWGNMFGGVAEAPIGKGRTYEDGNEAIFEGEFFDTQAAKEMYAILKALGSNQEWSFSLHNVEYNIIEDYEGTGDTVYSLKSIDVHEVSPVLMGAGVNTRTLEVKSLHELRSMNNEEVDYKKLYEELVNKNNQEELDKANTEAKRIAHSLFANMAIGG